MDSEKNKVEVEGEETLFINSDLTENEKGEEVYPDAVLNISRETASVFQMKRKWEKTPPMLDLTPPFQRDMVWSLKQKCELIESIIMGIPLPAFYVKETELGVYVVVDGKQRLGTLFDFINGEFRLDNLSVLKDRKGASFEDLSPVEQNKIEDYTLSINVIKAPTSDRVTFDLFDRVNRGGTRLNNQEMRNALYQGTSTRLINELAKDENFLNATEHSITSKHMKDRYLVLRFLAFYLWHEKKSIDLETGQPLEYKSNVEDFLGKTMLFLNRKSDNDPMILDLKKKFSQVMRFAAEYVIPLGGYRLKSTTNKNKRPINMAFFESFSCLISNLDTVTQESICDAYDDLLQRSEYVKSLTYSIDSVTQITNRYNCIQEYLKTEKNAQRL